MTIQPLRGFRDFYPEDQIKINYLYQKIAETSSLFGYEEFEGPALEPFELYTAKSSDEIIAEQAFVFDDRGGEKVVLRPELTPTLARMVAGKQGQLRFPLRWWSFGRFWRYERPQKGRGREFYQWNCDLIGDDTLHADVEILTLIITFLQRLGLTANDVQIEINDRQLVNNLLKEYTEIERKQIMRLLDKLDKVSDEQAVGLATKAGFDGAKLLRQLQSFTDDHVAHSSKIQSIMDSLKTQGIDHWVSPSIKIVRGFDYYTGLVFEVSDKHKRFRALLGGGRYENLINQVGGQAVSAIGFGMGDMVILSFLEDKGLLPLTPPSAEVCVIGLESTEQYCLAVVAQLRQAGIATLFYGTADSFSKGLKFANQKAIPHVILIGPNEVADKKVILRDLTSSQQKEGDIPTLLKLLRESK